MTARSPWCSLAPSALLLLLGWTASAQAATESTLTYGPESLILENNAAPVGLALASVKPAIPAATLSTVGSKAKKVTLLTSDGQPLPASNPCTLNVVLRDGNPVITSPTPGDCAVLWKARNLLPGKLKLEWTEGSNNKTLTVQLEPKTIRPLNAQTHSVPHAPDTEWQIPSASLGLSAPRKRFIHSQSMGWDTLDDDKDGLLTLPAAHAEKAAQMAGLYVVYEFAADRLEGFELKLAAKEPEKPQVKEPALSVEDQERAEAFASCVDPAGRGRQVLCVDAYDPRTGKVRTPEITGAGNGVHVLRPNASVLVMVRYPEDRGVKISMQGERGLTALSIKDESGQDKPRVAKTADSPPPPRPQFAWRSFAPRKPGNADVRVQILDGTTVVAEETLEMIVETTYIGALRVGLSMVGGGALDRGYEARAVGGTATPQVVQKDGSVVQPELVVGFAPFVIEALAGRGRGYSGQESFASRLFRLAPYVGLGVLTNSPNGIDGFKSFYFGAEWELAPSFSVAFTGVVRRVTRLGSGVQEGSPAPDGSVPTQTQHELGWGVVVNITPSFLRLANQPASGFFR